MEPRRRLVFVVAGLVAVGAIVLIWALVRDDGSSAEAGVEGCRDFAMSTTIEGTSIEFGGPATDETLCTDPALRTQPFLDTITAATTITTTEGLLQLDGPGGEIRFEQIETIGDLREPEPPA